DPAVRPGAHLSRRGAGHRCGGRGRAEPGRRCIAGRVGGCGTELFPFLASSLVEQLVGGSARFIDRSRLLVLRRNNHQATPPALGDVIMRIRQLIAALALGTAAVALSACAEQLNTTVSRYQAMPAPQGQTFFVVPAGGMAANGGVEFQRYAGMVAQQLQARGVQPATSAQGANMIVQFGYGVDHGQVQYVEDPFYAARGGYAGF